MVDIHSHILYGIDDGSRDLENSVKMAKEAVEKGFTHICCTPHYLEPDYVSDWKENEKRLENLKQKLKEEKIDIELRLGNEIFITENSIEDIMEKRALKLNESKYVLVEFPMITELRCCEKIIEKLLGENLKVIIAHPERYKYVQDNPDYVIPYIKKGVLLQCNFGSIYGMYGESARICINELLKREMVHVLATDAHKTNSVYYKVDQYINKLKEKITDDYLEELIVTNPTRILNNEVFELRAFKKKKRFIFF